MSKLRTTIVVLLALALPSLLGACSKSNSGPAPSNTPVALPSLPQTHPLTQSGLQSLASAAWKQAEQGQFSAASKLLSSAEQATGCYFKVSAGILKPTDLHLIADATRGYMSMGATAVATKKGPVSQALVDAIRKAYGEATVKGLPKDGFYVVTIAEFC